jgi:hypothetical protein
MPSLSPLDCKPIGGEDRCNAKQHSFLRCAEFEYPATTSLPFKPLLSISFFISLDLLFLVFAMIQELSESSLPSPEDREAADALRAKRKRAEGDSSDSCQPSKHPKLALTADHEVEAEKQKSYTSLFGSSHPTPPSLFPVAALAPTEQPTGRPQPISKANLQATVEPAKAILSPPSTPSVAVDINKASDPVRVLPLVQAASSSSSSSSSDDSSEAQKPEQTVIPPHQQTSTFLLIKLNLPLVFRPSRK